VKILDFGLSRFLEGAENNQLTKTGCIMGTPAYMAPEHARGQRVDQRADIYGVGAILYTALTGQPPFDGETPHETVLAVLNSEPPRPRSLEPSIPHHLELVLERALARDPAQRFPDVASLERALARLESDAELVVADRPKEARAAELPPSPRPSPLALEGEVRAARPRLLLWALAGLALLMIAAAASVSGIELLSGYRFNRVELGLFMLAVLGTSLTPVFLWFSYVRKKIWSSSSRVLRLLDQARATTLAFIASYGIGVLGLHFVDDFLIRAAADSRLKPVGASWAGWNLLLPIAALVLSLAIAGQRRLANHPQRSWARAIAGVVLLLGALAIVAGVVVVGLTLRARF
jgi:serine/threonine-protein kinase